MKRNYSYPSKNPLIKLEQEMKLKGFSQKTIKSYLYYITDFSRFTNKKLCKVNTQDIRSYLEKLIDQKKSQSTINITYSALKLYFEKNLRRKFFINIPRVKKTKKLPHVLTTSEVKKILSPVQNVKHKLMLATIYSAGLRVSELPRVKVKDLDLESRLIRIRQGKGGKDRMSIISEDLSEVLKKYIKNKKSDDYIFESNRGGKLTERTVQKVFADALKKSGVKKQASCHSLRHSFATHLLENGTDIRYIQELLGHKRLETTQIYTKVANDNFKNIKNPLDL